MQGLFIKPTKKIGRRSVELFAMTHVIVFFYTEFDLKIETSHVYSVFL